MITSCHPIDHTNCVAWKVYKLLQYLEPTPGSQFCFLYTRDHFLLTLFAMPLYTGGLPASHWTRCWWMTQATAGEEMSSLLLLVAEPCSQLTYRKQKGLRCYCQFITWLLIRETISGTYRNEIEINGKSIPYLLISWLLVSQGPGFCLLHGVISGCAWPITGQVTSVTWPEIGWA